MSSIPTEVEYVATWQNGDHGAVASSNPILYQDGGHGHMASRGTPGIKMVDIELQPLRVLDKMTTVPVRTWSSWPSTLPALLLTTQHDFFISEHRPQHRNPLSTRMRSQYVVADTFRFTSHSKHPQGLCPASNVLCFQCGKMGHFAVGCRSRSFTTSYNEPRQFAPPNRGGNSLPARHFARSTTPAQAAVESIVTTPPEPYNTTYKNSTI